MSDRDRTDWDDRYADAGAAPVGDAVPPPVFVSTRKLTEIGSFEMQRVKLRASKPC